MSQPAENSLARQPHKYNAEKLTEHFWSRINKDGRIMPHMPHLGKCWEWTLATDVGGYGYFKWFGIGKRVHRISWMLNFGNVPDGLWVCHRCDNPCCVNPDHLFLGDAKANSDDMIKKGRRYQVRGDECMARRFPEKVTGSNNGMAKLNESQVREIKRRILDDHLQIRIAEDYKVSEAAIYAIKIGRNWSHITLD